MAEAKVKNKIDWKVIFKGMDKESLRKSFLSKMEYNIAKDKYTFTEHDGFLSLSYAIRDRLIERWILTQQEYYNQDAKRIYYLSLEFLMGRLLDNNIVNLGIKDAVLEAMEDLGLSYEDIEDQELDAGLGNGGLGRLAACFLDSLATMALPAVGYGIRYEFGIFTQKIINGYQNEFLEDWLANGNPWEIERPEYKQRVHFFGNVEYETDENGKETAHWVNTNDVLAIPYDTPIVGYGNNTVNTLRLWSARADNEFDLEDFQRGDYIGACQDKVESENISKILYPNDNNHSGKELRLKQQYFFTSSSLQDIIRRHLKAHKDFSNFAEKNAIQLNDTHPAIAIVELMRLLVDLHDLEWDDAWKICSETFAYTNHTLMPEALEKWSVGLMKHLLPRHMDIIYKINSRFLRQVSYKYPGDLDRRRRMSLIEEGPEPMVRMAYLAIVGSHSVNGVARLHTELLTNGLVRDFFELWPEKFNNKTNGITQRRWLQKSNRGLSELITSKIGDGWITDLYELKKLEKFAEDKEFGKKWREIKYENKKTLAAKLMKWENIELNVDSMFDIQIKRMHEYKRQLLNILHAIHLYTELKDGNTEGFVPRTIFIAGKAAPGYYMAKRIIKLANNVAKVLNNDPDTKDLLQLHFVPNYRVSLAEYLFPASELSEQISTAGTEASGTGNMKFALNGALTIGTMDGANVEMHEEIGDENMFIFGLGTKEVEEIKADGYNPQEYFDRSERLKKVINLINTNFFSPEEPDIFKDILDSLFNGDRYMVFADFDSFIEAQKKVSETYKNEDLWTKMSIMNVANIGKFSSDRTISDYNNDIWKSEAIQIPLEK